MLILHSPAGIVTRRTRSSARCAWRRWTPTWRRRLIFARWPRWSRSLVGDFLGGVVSPNVSASGGYGSIPINTIFRGMNIHLPAILMFTRGTRFWHTARTWGWWIWVQLIQRSGFSWWENVMELPAVMVGHAGLRIQGWLKGSPGIPGYDSKSDEYRRYLLFPRNIGDIIWWYHMISYPIGSMVLLYMVLHGSHQYTPFMLVYIYTSTMDPMGYDII